MLEPVPVRIGRRRQPEVTGQVDHLDAGLEQRRGELGAGAVREGTERHVRGLDHVGDDRFSQDLRAQGEPGEVGVDLGEGHPHRRVGAQERHVGMGMGVEQADQLAAGVPGRSEHGDADGVDRIGHDG